MRKNNVLLGFLAAFIAGLIGHQTKPLVDWVFNPRDQEGLNRLASYTIGSLFLFVFECLNAVILAPYFTKFVQAHDETRGIITVKTVDEIPHRIATFAITALPFGLATFLGWILYDATIRINSKKR